MSDRGGIRRHVLEEGDVSVAILNRGCITQDWQVPLRGARVPVVLGYADPAGYAHNPRSLGIIAGRVANRISGAGFTLDGVRYDLPANEAPNHIHGGPQGLHARLWEMEADGPRAVRLTLVSPHGEGGYPGRLDLTVTIRLEGDALTYDMRAVSDRPTLLNLAQHSYYSLGAETCRDFRVTLPASRHTVNDAAKIPTGEIAPTTGQLFDFRTGRRISEADPDTQGLDMNFVLDRGQARVTGNGLVLEIETDQPCLQLYTGQYLGALHSPLPGQRHAPFSGLCLEPQGYPNAVNTPGFPCPLVTPDHPYRQRTTVRIREQDAA
ncbi:aldose epimerase family protein [Ruegeria sp. PrR005]|uniref:Galactose mutarotase n=1 Tax=Ruegeria sp. PrR005 TaxID=2706882 RepID=A0A6B2NQZ9_9RHOB|nr:aldose epimerase family protein [Ruegeria sp. PrR005]NDW44997.1 galactose mutarotase [Ruegeria sp. PrR005]